MGVFGKKSYGYEDGGQKRCLKRENVRELQMAGARFKKGKE